MRGKPQPSINNRHRLPCLLPSLLPILSIFLILLLFCAGISTAGDLPITGAHSAVQRPVISASEEAYPPYSIVSADNQADGFSVELLRAALNAMGREVSFDIGPWADIKQQLADGDIEVLPLVGRTPERERDFDFTFPYLTMHGTIVVRDNETGIQDLTDLRGKRLAVMRGDNAEEFVQRSNLGATIVTTRTFDEALSQLAAGQHDAVVIQKLVALQLIQDLGLANLKTVEPPLADFVQTFSFAVKKGDSALLALLNEGLSIAIADGRFRQLHKKWFGPIEALELKKSRYIVGGDANYPPYAFLDENGQPAGYNVELTRAIARHQGIEIEIQLGPWIEIRDGLASRDIDVVQGMYYSPERELNFDFSPAHTSISHAIVVRVGSFQPRTMADLAGRSILVIEGDIIHDVALKQGLAKQLVPVKTQPEMLRLLSSGQYDSALVAKIPALYWINALGLKNLRLSGQPVLTSEYCYAVPRGDTTLLNHLAEGLSAIKATGEYREIYARWLGVYEKPAVELWDFMRYALFVLVPFSIVLLGSFLWTWTLKGKVQRTTAHLENERQRLAGIIAGTRAGTWEWNVQTGVAMVNNELAEMIGYSLKEIVPSTAETWNKFVCPDDLPKSEKLLKKHLRGASDFYECEIRMKHKNGQWIWVLARGAITSRTDDGKPLWMFGTHLNITERKRAEEELQKVEKLNSIGTLAGGIAHDFNNILAGLYGNLSLAKAKLIKDLPDHPGFRYLEAAEKSMQRATALTNQLLTFSKGGVPLKETLSLSRLIEEVVPFNLSGSSVEPRISQPDNLWLASIDQGQIQQVFGNLTINAKQAMPDGGQLQITLANADIQENQLSDLGGGRYIEITLADSGIGIAPEHLDRIFDPYFTTKHAGNGLGLASVYSIIKKHDGHISVASQLGRGTTFTLYLPAAEVQKLPIPPVASTSASRQHSARILVMDDEEMICDIVKDLLGDAGYRVETVANGTLALDCYRQAIKAGTPFDLVILDLTIPGGTGGKEVVKQILDLDPQAKVVVSSGYADDPVMANYADHGFKGVAAKPYELSTLMKTVNEVLTGPDL